MKYILGVLGVLAVIILAVVLIFNRDDSTPVQNDDAPTSLIDYADKDSTVSHTTYGPLVSEEERRAVRITVTPNERIIEILSGYEEVVIDSQTYQNNQAAYENFLSGLSLAGFTNSKKTSITDERGLCPEGNRFAYQLKENNEPRSNLWSTSCNKLGSFAGTPSAIRKLFQEQIPDYRDLTKSVEL